jgi:TP901 family phage tail tape measure protein
MGKALSSVGAAAKISLAFLAASAGIQALTRGLSAGVKEIIDFDQALKNLQAITKSTDAEVAGMGEVIKKVATETKFSTGEVAEGMVLLGQAGFSVTEAMQSMASVANLATGTLSDMKMTSDLLTTAIRAFGLSTVESTRVADVMANAINRSKLTIDKLRIAFNFVGAASAQAGLSIEETAGSMMLLANHGLRASTIGTGLRQVMSRLLAPNRKLREEFKEQGIALERVNPATQGWTNALQNLVPLLINTETGLVDMAKAYRLFGLRGAQAVAILAKGVASGNYEKMIEFTMEVGSAARMAATQMEGLGVKIKNLSDRMKLIAVALGEAGLTAAFKVLIDALRATAKAATEFINSKFGQLIVAFAGWTIVIGAFTKSLRLLIGVFKFLLRPLAGFFGAITATKAATVAAGVKFKWLHTVVRGLVRGFGPLVVVLGAVVGGLRKLVTSIRREISEIEKLDTKTQTVIQTLSLYASKLEELIEKKGKDEDVTKAHSKTIEQFQQAIEELEKGYSKLDIALDENIESLEDNLEATENLIKAQLVKSVQANIDLIEKYNKQIERTKYWLVIWNRITAETIGWLENLWATLNRVGNAMIEGVSDGAKTMADSLRELNPITRRFMESLDYLGEVWNDFWDGVQKRFDDIASSYTGKSKKIVDLTEAQRSAFVRAALGLDLLGRGARNIEDIILELETLSGKKIDIKGIELINDALKKTS